MAANRVYFENLPWIARADIKLGGLNVFVGPSVLRQAKIMQTIKLLFDAGVIQETLRMYGGVWDRKKPKEFFDLVFGTDGDKFIKSDSVIMLDDKKIDIGALADNKMAQKNERVFYIPGSRDLAIHSQSGWFYGFSDYSAGNSFFLRDFSEKMRRFSEHEIGRMNNNNVVPAREDLLDRNIAEILNKTILNGLRLQIRTEYGSRRLVLCGKNDELWHFPMWSSGQRGFVPLLMGIYYLLSSSSKTQNNAKKQIIAIEDIEHGLHPTDAAAAMLLILEMVSRGYRVCLSTNSHVILEIMFALRNFRKHNASEKYVRDLFKLNNNKEAISLAKTILNRSDDFYVYYIPEDGGEAMDISGLNIASDNRIESEWGGIFEFTNRAENLVARSVANSEIFNRKNTGIARTR